MGVRTGAGRQGGGARACGGARRARVSAAESTAVSSAARSSAPPPAAQGRLRLLSAPFASYYACRVPRSLVLWCFMMVRHESARYADVPWSTRCQTCHRHKWAGRRDASSAAQVSGPSHLASLVKDVAISGSISCSLITSTSNFHVYNM